MKAPLHIAVVWWMAPFAPAQSTRCAPVEGEYILAREFAAAVPAFASLAPEAPLAPSPKPSVRRVFRAFEVELLARKYSITVEGSADVCFERPTEALSRERVLEAMQEVLVNPEVHIEIVEVSQFPVPHGKLVFRKEGLGVPASPTSRAPVTWHGDVLMGEGHRFSIWARVILTSPVSYVVAASPIRKGEAISAGQIREESAIGFPALGNLAQSAPQVVGLIALRDFKAGAEIRLNQLTAPQEVARGEMVEIQVLSGAARLALTGKAESSGRIGDIITIRNLTSNRIFQARVSGKGKALLDTGHLHRD